MRRKIAFHQYNLYEQHHYGLLLKSLNDARFSYTHKALPHAAKPKTGDCPYYLKSTIDYIKYLVTEMEGDQPITGRTVSTDCLYTSIESTNWLLDCGLQQFVYCRKGEAEYHLNFLTLKTGRFLVQLFILKKRRRTFA